MSSIAAQKRLLRRDAASRRDAMENDIGAQLIETFENRFQPPADVSISGYHPIGSEANVLPLLTRLRDRGYDIALPVVVESNSPLVFRRWRAETALNKGPFGILEPGPEAPKVRPDMVLTPLLAFDRSGNRLGYGGGFYDLTIRAIREHQPVYAIGVAYAAQEVPSVPHDQRDTVLDAILTEEGVIAPESENS